MHSDVQWHLEGVTHTQSNEVDVALIIPVDVLGTTEVSIGNAVDDGFLVQLDEHICHVNCPGILGVTGPQ